MDSEKGIDYRKQLWVEVAVAVASSDNATRPSSMTTWADFALSEFDKRFPEVNRERGEVEG